MNALQRPSWPRCLAVVLLLISILVTNRTGLAQGGLPADLAAFIDAGASVQMLAGAPFAASPEGQTTLKLSRVVPGAGTEPALVVSGGPELWFAESGQVVLAGEDGSSLTIEPGAQAVVQGSVQYTVQFDGGGCPSALRLELSASFAMTFGTDEAAPSLGPDGVACPAGGTLFQAPESLAARPDPALGFIARVTWPGESYVSTPGFSGPIGYAIESGRLRVNGLGGGDVELAAGSWASVARGQGHSTSVTGSQPASALVAGAFTSEIAPPTPIPTPTPEVGVHGNRYVSPSFGYTLSWDATWSVAAESTNPGADTLQLSNGVSTVYLQSYSDFSGDPPACIESIGGSLPGLAGFSEVSPRTGADGNPVRGGDGTRAFAAYDFTYTTETGSSRYTQYVECRSLIPGSAMLVITQIVLEADYLAQIPQIGALLKNLTIP